MLVSAQLTAQAPTQIVRPLSFVGLDPVDAEKGWKALHGGGNGLIDSLVAHKEEGWVKLRGVLH